MYLHERENWWEFRYDPAVLLPVLGKMRAKQGEMLGRLSSLGFDLQDEAKLATMSLELARSSEIEGLELNLAEVRSSIARRLGIQAAGLVPVPRNIDGVVEMYLDATQRHDAPLGDERLFGWHNVLFPTGMSGLYRIEVGRYRSGEMQVVSGPMGRETVHYEAPGPERVPREMARFIRWVNGETGVDEVLKAGIAHLWFVTIHPFDDGNGRIARAVAEMLLARSEGTGNRFYSVSNEIAKRKNEYYDVLERAQKGDGDVTEWLLWFLGRFGNAIDSAESVTRTVLAKARFRKVHQGDALNERQRKIVDMLFDGFVGKLTSGKWAKICKCSADTALNDINDLVRKGVLRRNAEGGRSTNYSLAEEHT